MRSKSYSTKKPSNSIESKHKRTQSDKNYSIEKYINVLEKKKTKRGVIYPFRSKKLEHFLVKQPKIALNIFDDELFFNNKNEKISCGHCGYDDKLKFLNG